MKFEELYLQLLAEQRDQDNDEPQDDNGVHGFDDGEFAGGDDEAEPEEPEVQKNQESQQNRKNLQNQNH